MVTQTDPFRTPDADWGYFYDRFKELGSFTPVGKMSTLAGTYLTGMDVPQVPADKLRLEPGPSILGVLPTNTATFLGPTVPVGTPGIHTGVLDRTTTPASAQSLAPIITSETQAGKVSDYDRAMQQLETRQEVIDPNLTDYSRARLQAIASGGKLKSGEGTIQLSTRPSGVSSDSVYIPGDNGVGSGKWVSPQANAARLSGSGLNVTGSPVVFAARPENSQQTTFSDPSHKVIDISSPVTYPQENSQQTTATDTQQSPVTPGVPGVDYDTDKTYYITGQPGGGAFIPNTQTGFGKIEDSNGGASSALIDSPQTDRYGNAQGWTYAPNAGAGAGGYKQNADGSFRRVSDVGVLNTPDIAPGMVNVSNDPNRLDPDIQTQVHAQRIAKIQARQQLSKQQEAYNKNMVAGQKWGVRYKELETDLNSGTLSPQDQESTKGQMEEAMKKLEAASGRANVIQKEIDKYQGIITASDQQIPTLMQQNLDRFNQRQAYINEYAQQRANPALAYADKQQAQQQTAQKQLAKEERAAQKEEKKESRQKMLDNAAFWEKRSADLKARLKDSVSELPQGLIDPVSKKVKAPDAKTYKNEAEYKEDFAAYNQHQSLKKAHDHALEQYMRVRFPDETELEAVSGQISPAQVGNTSNALLKAFFDNAQNGGK